MESLEAPRATRKRPVLRSPWRLTLAAIGVVCVGLGLAGIVVPGLPTTVFLIAASFLFARSCPWLEDRLLRHRVFAPYSKYLDGEVEMPRRARIAATATMWTAVAVSLTVPALAGRLSAGFAMAVVVAAVVGTVAITRFRRGERLGLADPRASGPETGQCLTSPAPGDAAGKAPRVEPSAEPPVPYGA